MKISFELRVNYDHANIPGIHGQQGRQDLFQDTLEIPDALDSDQKLGFNRKSFAETVLTLCVLAFAKSCQYGDSWQKRGEIRGAVANLDRKFDRISHSIEQWERTGRNEAAPRIDGAADLAVYALLYLSSYLREQYPGDFKAWWAETQSFIDRYRAPKSELKKEF